MAAVAGRRLSEGLGISAPRRQAGVCCSRSPVFATPSARVGINEELFSLTYQALHHCIGVVCTVQRFHGLGNLCHVLTDTHSVIQVDSQARVVRGCTFKLVDLPLGLPERVFCAHARIVPRWLTSLEALRGSARYSAADERRRRRPSDA